LTPASDVTDRPSAVYAKLIIAITISEYLQQGCRLRDTPNRIAQC